MVIALALILVSSPFLASAAVLTRQLQLGMSGSDVSQLQSFLAQDASVYPQGLVTGYFGSLTKAAVARYQTKNGISAVGRVGPQTMAYINRVWGGTTVGNSAPLSAVALSSVSGSQATVTWESAAASTGVIYYSTSPIGMTEATDNSAFSVNATGMMTAHTDWRTSHSGTLTGLSPNTTYYYVVYSRDAAGNENVTQPASFSTTN